MADTYYDTYKGFTIKHEKRDCSWRALYWKSHKRLGIVYETMLTETPEEARRLARLVIDSLNTLPEPLRSVAPEIDAAIRERFREGGEA